MSTNLDNQPVLELDGEKYVVSDLSDDARIILARMQLNEEELAKANMVVERLVLSKEGYTVRLKDAIARSKEEEGEEQEAAE